MTAAELRARARYRASQKGKEANRAYTTAYYHRVLKHDPEYLKKRAAHNKENHYRLNYGLTAAQAHDMKQAGCHLCGIRDGKMNIDHDHVTGRVRGVLCNACNIMVGYYERGSELQERIKVYLSKENDIAI